MSSVSHSEKIANRTTFNDWENRNDEFKKTSRNITENSFELRRESAKIRLETEIQTRWNTYQNEHKLSDRIWNVQECQAQLKAALDDLATEAEVLTEVKTNLETTLQGLTIPFAIAAECVSLRDARRGAEITRDQVANELQEELRVLETQKARLINLGAEAWQNQERIESLHADILIASTEQSTALNIDTEALTFTNLYPGISLRPEPARVAPQSSVPAGWISHYESLKQRQLEACNASRTTRNTALIAISQAQNLALAQGEEVDCALRNRVFTLQRALDDLEWQRTQLLSEISRARGELSRLDASLRSLAQPRQLCETRHELRTSRPSGVERCQDPAQDGLAEESASLAVSQRRLESTIAQARYDMCFRETHECLRNQLARIERDISDKQATLELERRCQVTRRSSSLPPHEAHETHANSSQL